MTTPHFPIYLDYGATNPCDPRVVDAIVPWLREHFGNPASRTHAWGWEAEAAVEKAREQVADLIGADPREIVWTSGATESNNLAIKGAAHFYKSRGKHLITVKTEHKAVLDTMRELERQGFEVTYLDVQEDGLLSMDALKAAIRPDTILISVMHVNNEIGVIQDVTAIGNLCREKGIIFHVDAAQATGKVENGLSLTIGNTSTVWENKPITLPSNKTPISIEGVILLTGKVRTVKLRSAKASGSERLKFTVDGKACEFQMEGNHRHVVVEPLPGADRMSLKLGDSIAANEWLFGPLEWAIHDGKWREIPLRIKSAAPAAGACTCEQIAA
jgi:hypothetical protein